VTDQIKQITDFAVLLDRVPQRTVLDDLILVLAADPFAPNKAFLLEILHNPLDRTFGDSDPYGHFTQNEVRVQMEDR
jgi:hypothetical protein